MTTKQELIAEVERSRAAIARDFAAVRREADLGAMALNHFRRHPVAWLGAALMTGWGIAGPKIRTRTKVVPGAREKGTRKKGGPLGLALKFAKFSMPVLKPALKAIVAKRLAGIAAKAR